MIAAHKNSSAEHKMDETLLHAQKGHIGAMHAGVAPKVTSVARSAAGVDPKRMRLQPFHECTQNTPSEKASPVQNEPARSRHINHVPAKSADLRQSSSERVGSMSTFAIAWARARGYDWARLVQLTPELSVPIKRMCARPVRSQMLLLPRHRRSSFCEHSPLTCPNSSPVRLRH